MAFGGRWTEGAGAVPGKEAAGTNAFALGFRTNSFALGLRVDFLATLAADDVFAAGKADPPAVNVDADSDDEDVDDTIPLDKDKFDKSGGTEGAATVGVGGVLVSTLAIPLPSIDCLLAILASGMVEGVSMLLPEA